MFAFPEPLFEQTSLRRYLLPLALLIGLIYALSVPQNPRLYNALNRSFPTQLDPRIVVVGIDNNSVRDYGRLELWPRALYAQALQNLNEAGVKVIGLDVLLSEPLASDQHLISAFNRPNLVRSVTPEDYFAGPHLLTSPVGVSVLNAPSAQGISEVQTAYPAGQSATLLPSFAAQVARVAGKVLPLDTNAHLIDYVPSAEVLNKAVSFRDVVNGNIRFADFQNRVVVIGVTASGLGNILLPDIDGQPVPGVALQARAISALLTEPFQRLSPWLTILLCLAVSASVVTLRGYWGFGIAALLLLLSVVGWHFRVLIPGVTLSIAAISSCLLVGFEQWWLSRRLRQWDPLTNVGNRLALKNALDKRWRSRHTQPFILLLADVNELHRINEQYGRLAGERVLQDLAQRLQQIGERKNPTFRWSPEEFAVLIQADTNQDINAVTEHYRQALSGFAFGDMALNVNLGAARTSASLATPNDLIEAASRHRYRLKYERERQA